MAVAALEQLTEWRVERVAAALLGVTDAISADARTLGLTPYASDERGPHLLGVRMPDAIRSEVVAQLAAANCYAALRGETLRIAPHLNVTDDDVRQLVVALAAVMARAEG
jgi:hypothetical protein